MANSKETPGTRLRKLINERGIKMKDFARYIDVTPTTLSKYVNDKMVMSKKTQARTAKLLNVSTEYLACEEDIEYSQFSTPQRTIDLNRQQIRFDSLIKTLKAMGVSVSYTLHIGTDTYHKDYFEPSWRPDSENKNMEYVLDGMDKMDFIKEVSLHPGECFSQVELTYQGRTQVFSNKAFQNWLLSLTNTLEYRLQDKFGVSFEIQHTVIEDDIDRELNRNIDALTD